VTRSRNHCCHGKALSITYYNCVSVVLVIQHATRMRHITLPYVAYLAVPYFSTLPQKKARFLEDSYWKCVLWFSQQLLSETFLILRRNEWDIIMNVHYVFTLAHFSCQILMELKLSRQIFEKSSKCHENPSTGSLIVPIRTKDIHTWRN